MKNLLSFIVCLFVVYAALCPDNTEVELVGKNGKQLMSIGITSRDKPLPKNAVSLDYFVGFFRDAQGHSLYIDALKGLFIWIPKSRALNFTVSKVGGDFIIVKYEANCSDDVFRAEDNGLSVAHMSAPDQKSFFKKVK